MECESSEFSLNGEGHRRPPDNPEQPVRSSFKDKLMGGASSPSQETFIDLVDKGTMKVVYVNDNPMLPKIVVDKEVIEGMCAPWRDALVVGLLGKRVGFRTMKAKLTSIWRLAGSFDLLDVDNGFYIVKFDMEPDRVKVMEGGPWMVFDHYLAVSTWSPEFISPEARVRKTLAWIRIPGLNVSFYDESYLMSAARVIGKPIRLDKNTLKAERGRFARICVEVDLDKPVVGKVCLENYWYKIEYEGLHVLCSKCGCYGHWSRECQASKSAEPAATPEPVEKTQTGAGEKSQQAAAIPGEVVALGVDSVGPMDAQGKEDLLPINRGAENVGIDGGNIQVDKINVNGDDADADVETHGEWMAVKRRTRKKKPTAAVKAVNDQMGKKKSNYSKGSTTPSNEVPSQRKKTDENLNGNQGRNKRSEGTKSTTVSEENLNGKIGRINGKLIANDMAHAFGGYKESVKDLLIQPRVFHFGSTSGSNLDLLHNKKRRMRGDE
ncbi:uncharacterized protein LOC130711420 [Lotus japonicus]|uniref:uncharacterized protein LOC130711420 n=1 Tax=Lotus japonicus TaxID=34305 RepID=UPI0025859F7C|nr:uncharacterized protein LOC130711420 [Lotus japonicus]